MFCYSLDNKNNGHVMTFLVQVKLWNCIEQYKSFLLILFYMHFLFANLSIPIRQSNKNIINSIFILGITYFFVLLLAFPQIVEQGRIIKNQYCFKKCIINMLYKNYCQLLWQIMYIIQLHHDLKEEWCCKICQTKLVVNQQ
jgi:hypothetical protein